MPSRVWSVVRVALVFALLLVGAPGALAQSMFNQQIPIKLPRGANGMQPDLALVYSPDGGNGIVGMGWQLTGLATITRVSYGSGIGYAGDDSYAHSQVGVLIPQADGSYRSKSESFVMFVPSGTCGDGPCSWTAHYPSGGTAYYGTTSDSRVLVQGKASIRTWGVAKVSDLFNNSYEVAYTVDAPNGQFYPNVVTYTKAPNISTYRTVEFAYEGRTDTEPNYHQNAFEQTLQRLRWISVKSAGRLVRKYRLDYECSSAATPCSSSKTGRSRLKAVTETGSDGVSALPSQTFTYQDGGFSGFAAMGPFLPFGGYRNAQPGDFNGDGKTDILTYSNGSVYVLFSNGNGSFTSSAGTPIAAAPMLADFDGDGKTDLMYPDAGDQYHVAFSNGDGSFRKSPQSTAVSTNRYSVPGDFNGDGMTDLLLYYGTYVDVLLSNGDGTFTTRGRYYDSYYGLGVISPGDFDGDGRTDFINWPQSWPFPYVAFSNGDGTFRTGPTFIAPTNGYALGIADFNGDGRTDLLYGAYPMLSRGDGTFATGPALYVDSGNSENPDSRDFLMADVNGDGKADILNAYCAYSQPDNCTASVFLSNGDATFVDDARYVYGLSLVGLGFAGAGQLGDFNGDGSPDFFVYNWDTPYVLFGGVVAPDFLANISNGTGGTIAVAYKAAAQVPGAIDTVSSSPGIPDPAPRQLVTSVTTNDGRGGQYVTTYGYHDARVVPGPAQQQRYLGFGSVTITDNQTHQYVKNGYVQTPGCEGHLSDTWSYGSNGVLQTSKHYSYELTAPSGGTELCLETGQTAATYDGKTSGSGPITTQTTTTSYDAFANPIQKMQSADYDPTVLVSTQFSNDTTNWILGRVKDIQTMTGSTTLGKVSNTWTNNTITAKSEWLDSTGQWLTTSMTYDANGNLATVTSPQASDGIVRTTATLFDATFHAYPIKVTNALGQFTVSSYNDDGAITSFTDLNGNTTNTTYDVFWRKLQETRPDGGTTTYSYVNYGNPGGYPNGQYMGTVTTVASGRTAFHNEFFDGSGFKFQTVKSGACAGGVFTEVQRDAAGRPWKTSLPHCSGATPAWTTTTYDEMSRVATVTTPDNKTTSYMYGVDANGPFQSVTDPNGQQTTRHFNARGKVTSVVDPAHQTTSYQYDALGRLTHITLPNGDVIAQTWDSLGRKTSVMTTTTVSDTASPAGKAVSYAYDALNRVIRRQPSGETAATYTYDESWSANGKGHLTTRTDAGGTTKFGYTTTGQVQSATQTLDGSGFTQGFAYDLLGRVTTLTYPDGSSASYTYTNGGEHASVTLSVSGSIAAGATWTGFNAAGKPGAVSFNNGIATSYGYDVMNHLTSLTAGTGTPELHSTQLQNLTYDWYSAPNTGGLNIGSISDHRWNTIAPDGSNTSETQSFTYDAQYRLTQATGVWGTKTYAYDPMGSPTTFGGIVDRTISYQGMKAVSGTGFAASYDAFGNMVHKVLDGTTWDYTWTVDNRLATARKNGAPSSQMFYGSDGQRVKKVFSPATGPTVTTTYIGNMYEKRAYGDSSTERHTIHVYANGQLVASVTRSGNIATAFNNPTQWRNQWAQMQMYNGGSAIGAVMKTGHFVAAVASHPIVVRWGALAVFGLLAVALVFAFVRSRFTSAGSYRLAPRLRFAALPFVLMFTFTACFGGPGNEVQRGGSQLIVGDTTNGPAVGTYYYHRNHINSSSVITDASGTEVTRMVYLPFGEISQSHSSGNETVTSKFTGQEYDAETGLYNYGARYYDPAIGRFVSADTVVSSATDSQSFNPYTYARDNPIIYTDPTGHSFWSVISGVFNAIGNAIGSAMRGLWHAAKWVVNVYIDAVKFWIMGQLFALRIAKSMLISARENPMAAFAIFMAIAAGPPGWVALGASIVAQGMAMAAGVRDPMTLALIGAVAGGAAGGWTALLKSGAQFGVDRALARAGVPSIGFDLVFLGMGGIVNQMTNDPVPENARTTAGASATGSGETRLSGPRVASGNMRDAPGEPPPLLRRSYGDSPGTAQDFPSVDYDTQVAQKAAEWTKIGNGLQSTGSVIAGAGLVLSGGGPEAVIPAWAVGTIGVTTIVAGVWVQTLATAYAASEVKANAPTVSSNDEVGYSSR